MAVEQRQLFVSFARIVSHFCLNFMKNFLSERPPHDNDIEGKHLNGLQLFRFRRRCFKFKFQIKISYFKFLSNTTYRGNFREVLY